MRAGRWVIAAVAAAVIGGAGPVAADPALVASLRKVAEDHVAAYDREDQAGTMATIHTMSPHYDNMRSMLAKQFPNQDLQVTLVEFRYIGHDDEFAYARMKTKAVASHGGFAPNIVDAVVLFHHENGEWKYWSDHIIGVELME